MTGKTPIERMMHATKTSTQKELAKWLGLSAPSPVSKASTENVIPQKWLRQVQSKLNVRPEWILTGDGPMYLDGHEEETAAQPAPQSAPAPAPEQPLDPITVRIQDVVRPLRESGLEDADIWEAVRRVAEAQLRQARTTYNGVRESSIARAADDRQGYAATNPIDTGPLERGAGAWKKQAKSEK